MLSVTKQTGYVTSDAISRQGMSRTMEMVVYYLKHVRFALRNVRVKERFIFL